MLPQLREIEHRWSREVAVVGVHSGKFLAERVTARIREACARLGVGHPVLNDRQFRVWRSYAVTAWPTLVAVDPEGYVVGQHAGELTADDVDAFIARVVGAARERGVLRPGERRDTPDPPAREPNLLRYPGKVAAAGDRIAIADSGHHRLLVGRLDAARRTARVELIVGTGAPGFADGAPDAASFRLPQGLSFDRVEDADALWVADTGNHALRLVRLDPSSSGQAGAVQTATGTGRRVRTRAELAAGALASPWDVATIAGTLHLAMAGTHQLWSAPLAAELAPAGAGSRSMSDATERWGSDPDRPPSWSLGGAPRAHVGSGAEEVHDGPFGEAALAQPMALAADESRRRLWFADAESSAIRWADLAAETVGTVVGTGLFDFGDRDGTGDDVRLQHPQGLALASDGRILVADSYNDALKWVDAGDRRVTTWLRGLSEPAGVAISGGHAFIADTNAHRVAVVSLEARDEGEIWSLELQGLGTSP